MAETRTKPSSSTIRKLFALSMNKCAFPDCPSPIFNTETNSVVGEVCHICAMKPNGPRYDIIQTDADRNSFGNLILCCSNHHKVIDDFENLQIYTIEKLKEFKKNHEVKAASVNIHIPALSNVIIEKLIETINDINSSNIHMDFRGATIKAGGEGGYLGGSGGDGGIINIVGVTPQGFHESIDLNGENGKAPGAGGGGGGGVNFLGRPAENIDIENGLKISSIFFCDASRVSNGLFYTIGAGWTYFEIKSVPTEIPINILCIVETGKVPIDTLLQICYEIYDPDNEVILSSHFDLSILKPFGNIARWPKSVFHIIKVEKIGIFRIKFLSGDILLEEHDLEVLFKN